MEAFLSAAFGSVFSPRAGSGNESAAQPSSSDGVTRARSSSRTSAANNSSRGVPGRGGQQQPRPSSGVYSHSGSRSSGGGAFRYNSERPVRDGRVRSCQRPERYVDARLSQNETREESGDAQSGGREDATCNSPASTGERIDKSGAPTKAVNSDSVDSSSSAEAVAEGFKKLGNDSFKLGMYETACEYYGRAIAADGTKAAYFTNRALCHKRGGRWSEALADAEAALKLEQLNVKGLYIKGEALMHLESLDESVTALERALSLAPSSSHDIRHALLRAKKARHEKYLNQRREDREDLYSFLQKCISTVAEAEQLSEECVESRLSQLKMLFAETEALEAPFAVPDFLTCKIAMAMMDDPVVTPSGITYERALLVEHLKRNGPTDPITRQRCELRQLTPNYAVRDATEWFLEKYPWAYDS